MLLETPEEPLDIVSGRVMIQDLIDESLEAVVIDNRQNAKRTVVEFIGRNIAREVGKDFIEVILLNALCRFFFPSPPPSSGWCSRARKRDDLAIGARTRLGKASRPPRPIGRPSGPRDGCSGYWVRPTRRCWRCSRRYIGRTDAGNT